MQKQKWEYAFVTCQVDGQNINAVSLNGRPARGWKKWRNGDLALDLLPGEGSSLLPLYELSNQLGEEGWEFVSIEWTGPIIAIFKCPKPPGQ